MKNTLLFGMSLVTLGLLFRPAAAEELPHASKVTAQVRRDPGAEARGRSRLLKRKAMQDALERDGQKAIDQRRATSKRKDQ